MKFDQELMLLPFLTSVVSSFLCALSAREAKSEPWRVGFGTVYFLLVAPYIFYTLFPPPRSGFVDERGIAIVVGTICNAVCSLLALLMTAFAFRKFRACRRSERLMAYVSLVGIVAPFATMVITLASEALR